jgi:hypothetical protein
MIGLSATAIGTVVAFFPTSDVQSVVLFETKMLIGVVGPTAFGWFLFRRTRRRVDVVRSP